MMAFPDSWQVKRTKAQPRQMARGSLLGCISLLGLPSLAVAHQGAGPAEMGPPVIAAGLLACVCYWIVVLWPSSKKRKET